MGVPKKRQRTEEASGKVATISPASSLITPKQAYAEACTLTYANTPVYRLTNEELRQECIKQIQLMWQLAPKPNRFPGPQPVSLMRDKIPELLKRNYFVTEKTDGTRYLFAALLVKGVRLLCLINRACEVYVLDQTSVQLKRGNYPSLLDAELVFDRVTQTWKLLIMDIVHASGYSDPRLMRFHSRHTLYHRFVQRFRVDQTHAPFIIVAKRHYPRSKLRYLLDHVIPHLTHSSDGLIFTPDSLPVETGTHWLLFKVKTHHVIDLMLRYVPDDPQGRVLHVQTQGYLNHQDELVNTHEWPTIGRYTLQEFFVHGRIPATRQWADQVAECEWSQENQAYTAVLENGEYKFRADKQFPNNALTVHRTKQNMVEKITFEELTQLPPYTGGNGAHSSQKPSIQKLMREQQEVACLDIEWFHSRVFERAGPAPLTLPILRQRLNMVDQERLRHEQQCVEGSAVQRERSAQVSRYQVDVIESQLSATQELVLERLDQPDTLAAATRSTSARNSKSRKSAKTTKGAKTKRKRVRYNSSDEEEEDGEEDEEVEQEDSGVEEDLDQLEDDEDGNSSDREIYQARGTRAERYSRRVQQVPVRSDSAGDEDSDRLHFGETSELLEDEGDEADDEDEDPHEQDEEEIEQPDEDEEDDEELEEDEETERQSTNSTLHDEEEEEEEDEEPEDYDEEEDEDPDEEDEFSCDSSVSNASTKRRRSSGMTTKTKRVATIAPKRSGGSKQKRRKVV